MTRFIVTGRSPKVGRVQHVMHEKSEDDARARFARVHPGAFDINVRQDDGQ